MSARIDLSEGLTRGLVREGLARLRSLDPRWWRPPASRSGDTSQADWDRHYTDQEDPYGYAEHREHYERRLALLGERRFHRALELACSIGVFTEMLAPRCGELTALDTSEVAVERARARIGSRQGVTLERRTFPDEPTPGPFDLIVCADFLYYSERGRILAGLRELESALAPGGILLMVHWRQPTPTHATSGNRVHRLVVRETTLRHTLRRTEWSYRFDCFERV